MDPIHPILPQRPNIPPVSPAPRIGGVDRDRRREEGAGERDRSQHHGDREDQDAPDSSEDDAIHIDVTA